MHRISMLLVVLAMIAAACAGDSTGTTETTSPPTEPTSTAATTTTEATAPETTTTVPPVTTVTTLSDTELPGEPFDLAPQPGAQLSVIGVAFDDTLNLRLAPGIDQEILMELEPTEDEMIASGQARLLPNSIWFEVTCDGTTGWVSSRYTGLAGAVDDLTSMVVARLGAIPVAETMLDLGQIAADALASTDPPSRIAMVVAPTVGDLGEVTFDVIGLGDDAQVGWRLHVFGAPTDGGEGFSLKSVEATSFCVPVRGVSEEGLCA